MKYGLISLTNAIVLTVCTMLAVASVLPSVQRYRHQARSEACTSNFRTLGLAIHNYHSAYKQLPMATGGTVGGDTPESSNQGRLGPLVGLLPFVEQQRLWEQILNPVANDDQTFPSMGPVPWYDPEAYPPWGRSPAIYQCPDRPGQGTSEPGVFTTLKQPFSVGVTTNYVICYGDGTLNVGMPFEMKNATNQKARVWDTASRGMFRTGLPLKFRDILDGLSNTLMMSETRSAVQGGRGLSGIAKNIHGLAKNPSLCIAAAEDADTQWWDQGRGSRWVDGALPVTGFQTVLPPNSPSCTDVDFLNAVVSASSYHAGGVHVLFGDGRIGFASDKIDTGDMSAPGVAFEDGYTSRGSKSPYGIWGALGTRAAKEIIRIGRGSMPEGIEPAGDPRDRPPVPASYRTWQAKDTSAAVTAKFVRIIDQETVELEDRAGNVYRVPLNTLRDKDLYRAVMQDLAKKNQND